MRLAAIMTCHNRKDKTLACLKSLFSIIPDVEVYLTDDGCTDGTAEAVGAQFPQTNIVKGNGGLFWSRGMYTAWKEAQKGGYDFYLWLNDDVELFPGFMQELRECAAYGGDECVVSGLIADKDTRKIIYGGCDKNKRMIGESDAPQEITYMNGNVVLIPQSVVDKIGLIDPRFHHDLGDVDYGLTAKEHGIAVLSTRKAVAWGYTNNYCRVRKWGFSLAQRWSRLHSPLGSPPALNFHYRRKHWGVLNAIVFCSFLYTINILPDCVVELIWKDAYKDKG